MRKIKIVLLLLIAMVLTNVIYAYWPSTINNPNTVTQSTTAKIGSWYYQNYNLNDWIAQDTLNQYIPQNQLFSYNNQYYLVRPGQSYNPYWHGLPGSILGRWAIVSVELQWKSGTNYRTNSVVTRNGKYYIANSAANTDWFLSDPATTPNYPWSDWLEIEPISEEHFDLFPGTSRVDYATPDFNYVVYI